MDTYDTLKKEIAAWSHRNDIGPRIDTFIAMAEREMYNNPFRILKIRGQETTLDTVTAGITLALPSDYQSLRELRLNIANRDEQINFRVPEQMKRSRGTGVPTQYTIDSQIEFNRTPDQNYPVRFKYYKTPTPLSSTNQTNEVLSANANIYLFGSLSGLFKYAQDDEQSSLYFQMFLNEIKGTNNLMKRGRYGVSPQMTLNGTTP
jgi:hypothetical protein